MGNKDQASAPLSLRAYARRRGVSPEAVSRAIERGRLRESVVRVGGAPKVANPELADREWARNTESDKKPIWVQERDERRQRARRAEDRSRAEATEDCPVLPFERFSVMVVDDDEVSVFDVKAPEDSGDGYCMSRDTARKLAAALLEAAGPETAAPPAKNGRRGA
jgi:hypothetical protein